MGRTSLLDLLNIQSDQYTYQTHAFQAMYEYRIAQARILATLGELALAYNADSDVTPSPSSQQN